ncbi:MAG TPA: alpha/beta hydrolase [Opitutaceae bacterium]|nr:alpha/beta hydrolase [Opitutaceae bacterium]
MSTLPVDRSGLEPAPYTSRFVDAGGIQLHYLDYGSAGRPPLLCVHGGAAHAHWFDFVAPGLRSDYRVRSLDLRGHGDSARADPPSYLYRDYAADLARAVEALDLRDFVLAGHSMGGMVSLLYAATYPGRLAKLIIIDTTMLLPPERVATMRDVGQREGSSYATPEEFASRFRVRPAGSKATPEVLRHLAQNSGRQGEDGRWRNKFDRNVYATRENIDGMPYWNRITVPALVVKGELSPRITPEIQAEIKARCPQVQFASVADSDHHVTLDNPRGFVNAVSGFLRG